MPSPAGLILIFAGIYLFVSGILVFYYPKRKESDRKLSLDSFRSDSEGPDRCVLIDSPRDAGLARIKLIEGARERLDIAYFSIESGSSPKLFFGALLEAADRGVEVRILLDGIFHGIKGAMRSVLYTCLLHPRMTLKFYEPPNPFLPWTFNNRMHDKYIIADGEWAIIGGRNIGDKYFDPDWYGKKVSHDRDVVIFGGKNSDDSVLPELSAYFSAIWDHKYSRSPDRILLVGRRLLARREERRLREELARAKEDYSREPQPVIDFDAVSFPTRRISLLSNPLGRFAKEARVWNGLTALIGEARESVFIQSPYVIPSKAMLQGIPAAGEPRLYLLTNSLASTPNWLAFAGYLNHRRNLIDAGIEIREYQSDDSLHTKACVIDGELMALGSFNVDPRSAYLSTELMVVIHSPEGVLKLQEGLDPYWSQSLNVTPASSSRHEDSPGEIPVSRLKRAAIALLRPLAALIEPFL